MPRSCGRASSTRELASARRAIRALDRLLARLTAQVRTLDRGSQAGPGEKPRRRVKLSPARLKALRLHGRYLGYIRQLKPRQRTKIKAIRAKKGVRAAIAGAHKLAV